MTTTLKTVYTVARNMDRMHAFYVQVLDLQPQFRDGDRWAQYRAGESAFALSSVQEAPPGMVGSVPVFTADDLAASCRAAVQAGGQLLQQRDMGAHGRVATLADPEGNVFQLFCRASSGQDHALLDSSLKDNA